MHFLIKNAFLTYYLRLSINRVFRLYVGLGFGLNIGLLLINLALIVFQCIPVAAAFTPRLRLLGAECMNRYYVLMAPSTVVSRTNAQKHPLSVRNLVHKTNRIKTDVPTQNVILDFYVFALPIPTLWRLQMPLRTKLGVISVFAFGGISVILSMIRFHSLIKLISLDPLSTAHGVGEIMIVASLELNVAAIAVNLPAIRSIYVKLAKKHAATKSGTGDTGGINRSHTYTVSTMSRSPQKINFELQKPPRNPPNKATQSRSIPAEPGSMDTGSGMWSRRPIGAPKTNIWAGRDSAMQEKIDNGSSADLLSKREDGDRVGCSSSSRSHSEAI